jgi:hypothetical protein
VVRLILAFDDVVVRLAALAPDFPFVALGGWVIALLVLTDGLGQAFALLKAASDAAIELADPSPNIVTSCDLVNGMFPSWCRRNVAS